MALLQSGPSCPLAGHPCCSHVRAACLGLSLVSVHLVSSVFGSVCVSLVLGPHVWQPSGLVGSLPCALCTLLAPTHVFFFSAGNKKLTNKATLWYVPLSLKNVDKVLEVPPVVVRRPSHCSADEVAASTSTRGCWVPAGSATGWVRGSRWGPSVRVLFTLGSQVQAGLGLWALPISAPEYVLEPLSCWPPCPSLLCLFVCLFVWLPHSIWCPQARDCL